MQQLRIGFKIGIQGSKQALAADPLLVVHVLLDGGKGISGRGDAAAVNTEIVVFLFLAKKIHKGRGNEPHVVNTLSNGVAFSLGLSAEPFCHVNEKDRFLGSYLRKVLQCAIKDLTTVSDDMRFYRFLCAVATSTGSAVNYANLGNAADISSPTAKQWMAFLEGAGVVHLLWPIEHASLRRVAKGPKVYFVDTGLAAYLLRIKNEEDLAKSTYFTALFETYVVNTIRESYLENGLEAQLTYFRDSNAKEISVLLRYGDVLYPIEIKKEQTSITKLRKKFKLISGVKEDGLHVGNGCVVALGKNVEQLAEDLWQIGAGCL